MGKRLIGVGAFGAVCVVVCIVPSAVQSGEICQPEIARFVSAQGVVELLRATEEDWEAATLDLGICPGDQVRVGAVSRVAVAFLDSDTVLNLDQNTTIEISEPPEAEFSFLHLFRGVAHFFSRKPRALEVETPFVNAAVEGTEFLVRVDEKETFVIVFEGQVSATNEFGTLKLASNQAMVARAGQAPESEIVVRPRDAVQWALYYPRLFAVPPPGLPANLVAASELLAVGRVDEARTALNAVPDTPLAVGIKYALLAVIAVAQNDKEDALTAGRRAVDGAPQSSAAKIALSYALQASFELEAARDTLREAVKNEPDDALAWARLAELWLSLGYLDEAVEAAEEAQLLSPDLARTNTVLGFANLAQINLADAKAAFGAAIEKDDRAPLPRLGLGLAKIRGGDLEEGRRDIEIAALLNPDNSLIRSYLGKAYFEEKRGPLDAAQFEIAKELDPLDPTPSFYDAIRKQTENRPIEALEDLQASIARNENRAVYRGRLQLDQDRAARGTSLARIYDDLGFTQLGVSEASKSLALDPANASAHRFLSDSYGGVRRREIARVSELLQAQLLQDININPVQPSISETNLNIITRGGPAEPGFNEFTPLFERNQVQLNANGQVGNQDTLGGEAVVSALYNQFSISAGAFHYETDGFRPNNDIDHDIYNFFAQAALTPELNLQVEVRRRESKEGDLELNFDPDLFLAEKERNLDQDILRVGARYSPTPNSDVLFSFIYSDREERLAQTEAVSIPPPNLLDITTDAQLDDEGYQVEAQYLYRRNRFNVTAGLAYSNVDRDLDASLTTVLTSFFFPPPFPPFIITDTTTTALKREIEHYRGYVYANVNIPDPVTWTVGVSYDNYDEEETHVDGVNPKVGVQWDITENLRLRAALTQTVKPALVANRTIEPTQVAGFNQFFDDINATESFQYGGGLDWRLTEDLSVGAEATWRHLDEPLLFDGDVVFEDRDEQLHRAYLYWTPLPELALSGEFVYDRYKSEAGLDVNLPREVETISVPLIARYFHPSGFFAGVGATYVHQEVDRPDASLRADGTDSFFTVDAAIGWRLPNRLGIVSLEGRNLFDNEFKFQDDGFREFRDEPSTSPYIPDRTIIGRVTLNF